MEFEYYESSTEPLLTILILGNPRVGKSSILRRHFEKDFNHIYFPTEGVCRTVSYIKSYGEKFKILVWDVNGDALANSENIRKLTSFIQVAKGFLFVYDITDQKSFVDITKWISTVDNLCDNNSQKILLGNKADKQRERMVEKDLGEALANLHQMRFLETSASSRTDTNIKSAFCMMTHDIRRTYDLEFALRFDEPEDDMNKLSRISTRKRIVKCFTSCCAPCAKKCQ